jgi:Ala-tRNA(Pro) deacylase
METCLARLEQYLTENRVYYEVQEHRQAFTIQEVAAALHEKGMHVAKVFIAWADGQLIMLVLPAPARVDLDRVRDMLGATEVRRAHEAEFARLFPDCDVGAMPPLGNLYDVPVYLDNTLADQSTLVFQAGSHRATLKIAMSDYWRLARPKTGDFALTHKLTLTV